MRNDDHEIVSSKEDNKGVILSAKEFHSPKWGERLIIHLTIYE